MIRDLFNPATLANHPDARLVYDDPTTQTRVWRVRHEGVELAIKHARYSGLRRRIRWRLQGSPGQCEFDAAHAIAQAGIPTAEPLAFVQHTHLGLPSESWLAVRWLQDAPSLYRQPGGQAMRHAVSDFVARLFRAGVYPADLTPGNLLAKPHGNGDFDLFLIDQVEVARGQPLDAARMAKLIGRFALRASCPDCWGPWAAAKWLAGMVRQLHETHRPAAGRQLWRQAVNEARARQVRIEERYLADEPATRDRPRVRKEVLRPLELPAVIAAWRQLHAAPAEDWRRLTAEGREWVVFSSADPAAAAAVWRRLMVMWNRFIDGPRPAVWAVERDVSLIVAEPVVGVPIAAAFEQATQQTRDKLIWLLARLGGRLHRDRLAIAPESAAHLVAIFRDARLTSVEFDRDISLQPADHGQLPDWRQALIDLGLAEAGTEQFARQFVGGLTRALRLMRWSIA